MAADVPRHAVWMALEVSDPERYARYRTSMAPLLASFGGRFDHDFGVAHVYRSSAGEGVNRVFAISFPDRASRARFFADPRYLAIRAELFEPAVVSATQLAEYAAPPD